VTLNEGSVECYRYGAHPKKSLERIVAKIKDQFGDEAIKVAIVHSQDPSTADLLKEMMEPVLNITETIFTELVDLCGCQFGAENCRHCCLAG
jgi:fatty acid-binding protein DegV